MKKKLLALLLACVMGLALAACGGGSKDTYKVGICQLAPHPALDAATQGFIDALNEKLPDQVEIDNQNAAGDTPTCATIINGFVSSNVDLILANATPALQAAASATNTIPVLGTSITEYGVALGIDNFSGTVGTNVSGTSDLAPLDQQAAMIHEWYPDAQNVAWCTAPLRTTASTRWTTSRSIWRTWATPASSTPSLIPTTWPAWCRTPPTTATCSTCQPTTPPPTTPVSSTTSAAA